MTYSIKNSKRAMPALTWNSLAIQLQEVAIITVIFHKIIETSASIKYQETPASSKNSCFWQALIIVSAVFGTTGLIASITTWLQQSKLINNNPNNLSPNYTNNIIIYNFGNMSSLEHRISLTSIQSLPDGGSNDYELIAATTQFTSPHGILYGYYHATGYYLHFKSTFGSHELTLDYFKLQRGKVYSLACYLKENNETNSYYYPTPSMNTGKTALQLQAWKLQNITFTGDIILNLTVSSYSTNWQRYESQMFACVEDIFVVIMLKQNPYISNGKMMDVYWPTLIEK